MKKSHIALAFGIFAVLLTLGVWSTYTTLVADEEGIVAQEAVIDTSIDAMIKKITGKGHVVTNFKEFFLEALSKTIGEGGRAAQAGAVFNAVSERYPQVPADLWQDLAATMSSEYEAVAASQKTKIDRLRTYKIHLRSPGFIPAKLIGGFPTISLEEHGKLILGSEAKNARETGTLETVDPFQKAEKN